MRTEQAIRHFINSCLGRNLSPITVSWYQNKLGVFAGYCLELPTEPGQIEVFLASIQGAPETRHAYFRVLRVFFRFIGSRFGMPNPMEEVLPPRCPKKVMATLEPRETMRLISSASSSLRDKAILTLLIDTGMRASELARIRGQDIKADTVVVQGKCGQREIPILPETQRLLLALVAQDGRDGYVFHGHKGPLTRKGVYRIVSTHMRKVGIEGPKLGPHRIRHAFGKGYLMDGGDLSSLQNLMGHNNITTTQKYAALNLNDIIKKHHQFTPLRAAQAAAQESFFDTDQAVKEAEAIIAGKKQV